MKAYRHLDVYHVEKTVSPENMKIITLEELIRERFGKEPGQVILQLDDMDIKERIQRMRELLTRKTTAA
ncbi:MAG: hypothetical protein GTN80_06110 [Nitrososphaeria archaeon]|nr:hypothetical protein [Nitrososphaeria archaeon]NIQ33199.1 hypothetical protein [Nitrososphaeria archaeon]